MTTQTFHGMSNKEIFKLYCWYIPYIVAMLAIAFLLQPFYRYNVRFNGRSWIHIVAFIPFFIMVINNNPRIKKMSKVWIFSLAESKGKDLFVIQTKDCIRHIPLTDIQEITYTKIENEKYNSPLLSGRGRVFKLKAKNYRLTIYLSVGEWTPYSTNADLNEMDAFFKCLQKDGFFVFDKNQEKNNVIKYVYSL